MARPDTDQGGAAFEVFRWAFRRQRWRTLSWGALFVLMAAGVVASYESAYPTSADRVALAKAVGTTPGFQALYGQARALDTVGGFLAWRVGGFALFTGIWGLLTAARLLRGEEDDGRWELLCAAPTSRRAATAAVMAAIGTHLVMLWAALSLALLALGLPATPTLVYAKAYFLPALVFGAVAAMTSQLSATRRGAAGLAGAALGAAYLLRVVADGTRTLGWLRWLTPLGWYEEARPYSGSRPLPLLLGVAAAALFCAAAIVLAGRRDLGAGALFRRTAERSSGRLLGSPAAAALRQARPTLLSWVLGTVAFAAVIGMLSRDVLTLLAKQASFQRVMGNFGVRGVTVSAYFGLMFTFVPLPIALYAALQLGPVREEESTGRLELVLSAPIGRRRWLLERLAVVAGGAAAVAAAAVLGTWAGAALRGVSAPIGGLFSASVNAAPIALLFLGIGVLVFATFPRATLQVAAGLPVAAYFLQVVGAFADLPSWLVGLSPFHHLAPVPFQPANVPAALVMLALGLVAVALGMEFFARRDLASE